MRLQIRTVNMKYDNEGYVESVKVYHDINTDDRTFNSNANFGLTSEEYKGNESIPKLEIMALDNIIDKLMKKKEELEAKHSNAE